MKVLLVMDLRAVLKVVSLCSYLACVHTRPKIDKTKNEIFHKKKQILE